MSEASKPGPSQKPGTGSDGVRPANADRSDTKNKNNPAHEADAANRKKQASGG